MQSVLQSGLFISGADDDGLWRGRERIEIIILRNRKNVKVGFAGDDGERDHRVAEQQSQQRGGAAIREETLPGEGRIRQVLRNIKPREQEDRSHQDRLEGDAEEDQGQAEGTALPTQLVTEIKIHKSLEHKNIVLFDHVFEDSDNVYMVLELCGNHTLN